MLVERVEILAAADVVVVAFDAGTVVSALAVVVVDASDRISVDETVATTCEVVMEEWISVIVVSCVTLEVFVSNMVEWSSVKVVS